MFMDPERTDERCILCFHPNGVDPPDQLHQVQTVPAARENVFNCLKQLFGGDAFVGRKTPIARALSENEQRLNELTDQIIEWIGPEGVHIWCPQRSMTISLTDPEQVTALIERRELPDDADLDIDPWTAGDVFGLAPYRGMTWHKLIEQTAERGSTAWVRDLGRACAEAAKKRASVRVQSTLRAVGGSKLYRPTLARVYDYRGRGIRFFVLFTEELRPGRPIGEGRLAGVYRRIRIGYRFRQEVIYPFRGKMAHLAERHGGDEACRRLAESIQLIQEEAEEEGLLNDDTLVEPFEDAELRRTMVALLSRWRTEIEPALRQALVTHDLDAIEDQLAALQDVHLQFMALCGRRFAELSEDDLAAQAHLRATD